MSDPRLDAVPVELVGRIEAAVMESAVELDRVLQHSPRSGSGMPLAIKYMPSRYGAMYRTPGRGLRISDRDGFTWGTGVYVTPLSYPISTGIYGRAGVVSWFDPSGWRTLDCRQPTIEQLYVAWLQYQPLLRDVLVTVHSDYRNHLLRDQFREIFQIDCVLFHPDETDDRGVYTDASHTWMAVADFGNGRRLQDGGDSNVFRDARLVAVLEEEFVVDSPALTRSALLKLGGSAVNTMQIAADIANTYNSFTGVVRVSS